MLETVGTGVAASVLVGLGGLLVRLILSNQAAAERAAAATAERYEKEIARLNAEREAERQRFEAEIEFWRSRALRAET